MGVSWWLDPPPGQEPLKTRALPKGTFKAKYTSGSCGVCHRLVLRNEVVRFSHREGMRMLQHYKCPVRMKDPLDEHPRLFDDLR